MTENVADDIRTTLRRLAVATVVVYLLLFGAVVWVFLESQKTTDALCGLRADLERRVHASEEFLKENPDGIAGLSARQIQTSLDGQRRSIEALSDLDCPPVTFE